VIILALLFISTSIGHVSTWISSNKNIIKPIKSNHHTLEFKETLTKKPFSFKNGLKDEKLVGKTFKVAKNAVDIAKKAFFDNKGLTSQPIKTILLLILKRVMAPINIVIPRLKKAFESIKNFWESINEPEEF
jgi:hypothetical protein